MNPKSDPTYIKIKYETRKRIIEGKVKMSYREALPLIGPDCAFHLYRHHDGEKSENTTEEP